MAGSRLVSFAPSKMTWISNPPLFHHCIDGPHGIMIKIDIFRWWLTLQVQTRSWCRRSDITAWICRITWWWFQQTFDRKHSIRITSSSRGRTRMWRGVWFHDYFQQVLTCCRLTRKHLTVLKLPQCSQPRAQSNFLKREKISWKRRGLKLTCCRLTRNTWLYKTASAASRSRMFRKSRGKSRENVAV